MVQNYIKKIATRLSRYDTLDGLDCMFFKKVIKKDEQIHYALSGGTVASFDGPTTVQKARKQHVPLFKDL